MSVWSLFCGMYGHDWFYEKQYRICDYCGKLERY